MSVQTPLPTATGPLEAPAIEQTTRTSRLVSLVALLAIVVGVGILAYAFSAFAIAVGAVLIGLGLVVRRLGKLVPGLA